MIQGVWEKDAERKDDSFNTFEEVMQMAVEHDVDLLLLGGDLFHDNKPSRTTVRARSPCVRHPRADNLPNTGCARHPAAI